MAKTSKKKKSKLIRKAFRQLCKREGLPEPEAEYMFHDTRRWRIDYYFEFEGDLKPMRVALEVEGGVWTGGRHVHPSGFLKDMEKYNELSAYGIFLIRCTPSDLCTIKTIELIKRAACVEQQ